MRCGIPSPGCEHRRLPTHAKKKVKIAGRENIFDLRAYHGRAFPGASLFDLMYGKVVGGKIYGGAIILIAITALSCILAARIEGHLKQESRVNRPGFSRTRKFFSFVIDRQSPFRLYR